MNRFVGTTAFLIVALLLGTAAEAQISISFTDMQNILVNSKRMNYIGQYFPSTTVDLGTASGSTQTFDFSGLPAPDGSDSLHQVYADPTGQPGAAYFPVANLCTPSVDTGFGFTFTVVTYFRLQSDGFYMVGMYVHTYAPPIIDEEQIEHYSPMRLLIPLPLSYGTNRTGTDTSVTDSVANDYTVRTTTLACDGWGDITFPSLTAAGSAPKTSAVSSLRATETEVNEFFTGGVYSGREKFVSVIYVTADGSLMIVEQEDSAYAGGAASVQSYTYSLRVGGATDVRQSSPAVPDGFALLQNYPNPFNPSTTIAFAVPSTGHVSLRVFDVLGREVATLVDRVMSPGTYEATFDAQGLPSGMYIYRIVSGLYVGTHKMNVVK